MKTLQVLIIKPDTGSGDALNDILRRDRFEVTAVNADEAAVEQFCQRQFDVIVIGKEWGENELKRIYALAHKMAGDAILIRQEDDNDEQLEKKIEEAYKSRQKENLGYIKVNDTLDTGNLAKDIRIAAP